MGDLVLLRWALPVRPSFSSGRQTVTELILPTVQSGGWLYSPGATHHVSDHGHEVWLTVVGGVDDTLEIRSELEDRLGSAPRMESTTDPLLSPEAEWYRRALSTVTHAALDVLSAGASVPVPEYVAFENPSEAVALLIPFLNETSSTYRRCCSTYATTEHFWLDFFRRAPHPGLGKAGRTLWDLAA